MAMNVPARADSGGQQGGLPRGELLGRYRTYEDAQKVVDHLAAQENFEIKALTIVGNDLRSVENIRSRLTYPKVAAAGAMQGALFGGFIGFIFYLFTPESPLIQIISMVLLGMAVWMIAGVVSYSIRRGRRAFASTQQLVATTYDVVCDFSAAQRARSLVQGAGVRSVSAANDPTGSQPSWAASQLGSRQGLSGQGLSGQGGGVPGAGRQAPTHSDPAQQEPGHQAGQGKPAEESGAPTSDVKGTAQGPNTAAWPKTGYEDLPDGRPRFGVRIDQPRQDENQLTEGEPEQSGSPERSAASEGQPQEEHQHRN